MDEHVTINKCDLTAFFDSLESGLQTATLVNNFTNKCGNPSPTTDIVAALWDEVGTFRQQLQL